MSLKSDVLINYEVISSSWTKTAEKVNAIRADADLTPTGIENKVNALVEDLNAYITRASKSTHENATEILNRLDSEEQALLDSKVGDPNYASLLSNTLEALKIASSTGPTDFKAWRDRLSAFNNDPCAIDALTGIIRREKAQDPRHSTTPMFELTGILPTDTRGMRQGHLKAVLTTYDEICKQAILSLKEKHVLNIKAMIDSASNYVQSCNDDLTEQVKEQEQPAPAGAFNFGFKHVRGEA